MKPLHYDINAMCSIEDALGCPLFEIISDKNRLASMKVLRALYWAGSDTGRSLEEAGEDIMKEIKAGRSFMDIGKAIMDAMADSGLVGKAEASENPQ